ncbi:MAG: aminopeptidase P family protein [Candidatus Bathyarchaeota archaeon]|nr:MAG: aminopeptidase P family protein [Candidatus Bathyarchaeota archaeon]
MKNRIERLRSSFTDEFDCYLVRSPVNMLYFTGVSGGTMLIVPFDGEATLYVYGVNYEQVKADAKHCTVKRAKHWNDFTTKLQEQLSEQNLKHVAFDSMDFEENRKLRTVFTSSINLEPKSEYVWSLRRIKDDGELKRMRTAAELTVKGMEIAQEKMIAGLREFEVAAEIEYGMRIRGSQGVAFETIVASGPHSAFPHGGCGDRKMKAGDVVVVDIGATYQQYRSDMTRTFVVGTPSEKQKKLYAVVKNAQQSAFLGMKDGEKAKAIDTRAREVIKNAGYGKHFVHGLGHGIGLEVHEQPMLNSRSKDTLRTGNVVTDEPGVYLVDFGGFRAEDTVLISQNKAERLTNGLYDL